ncbi:MAG: lamin tail domain-containing protein, partial [Bacteroidota bacterium]
MFFSEYIEGSSSNKALEIYNPTGLPVNLASYEIHRFTNGATSASGTYGLAGMLQPDSVYVYGNANAIAAILAESDTTGAATFYNGDDAVALINIATGDTVDLIGVVGQDPGTNWVVGTGFTSEFTLVRADSVREGTTNWALSSTQWLVFPQNTVDSLGAHTAQGCVTGPNCTDDIFFSEYIEGSSSNKAFELYNPTNNTVDLTDYVIYRFNNGNLSASDSLFPQGMLMSDSVFVVGNPSANAAIMAESDTTHTMTFYNGDDAMALINMATGDTLDIIGEIGVDPGAGWTVGGGATNNNTLIRQANVQKGETDWAISVTQWDVFALDMTDSLGQHSMTPCGAVAPTTISFTTGSSNPGEGDGAVTVCVSITGNTAATATDVTVMLNTGSSSATNATDFNYTDVTLSFPAMTDTTLCVTVNIVQDMMPEADETVVLDLMNPTNGATIGVGTHTMTIADDDFPTYPIGTINTVDGNGDGDSLGVTCWIHGIVYGLNMRPSGLQFTIID